MTAWNRPARERVLGLGVVVVLGVALWMRVVDLGHLPGLNGDEAWYGVQIERVRAGLAPELRAPSGRFSLNGFLVLLLAPVHLVAGPQVWVLRVPSLVAGLVAVGLAYAGLRRVWGRSAALATALLLAALPIDVAYSRFGWDPSLMAPFTVAVIALAGRGRWRSALLVTAAALTVHPTAVFLLPLVWGLTAGLHREEGRRPARREWAWILLASVGLVAGSSSSLIILYLLSGPEAILATNGGRYAVYVVPALVLTLVVCARHLARSVAPPERAGGPVPGTVVALAAASGLLVITATTYLQPLRQHGSRTHEAFLTAAVDPREQVWRIISAGSGPAGEGRVFGQNWWISEPLRYFAGAGPRARPVIDLEDRRSSTTPVVTTGDWVVARSGGDLDRSLTGSGGRGPGTGHWTVTDGEGRPAYEVFRVQERVEE